MLTYHKITKIVKDMFVTTTDAADTGNLGEVVFVGSDSCEIQWFRGECDTVSLEWVRDNLWEAKDEG